MSSLNTDDIESTDVTSSEAATVSVRGLEKRFGDVVAVEEFDLDVEAGELLVLLGPSGCGKTTTLRTIAGLESPSSGEIRLDGVDVTFRPPQDRDIAMVFQNYGLYPHKTVRGNMAFPLRKTDVDENDWDTRIERIAEMLDIGDLLDKKPASLSGGQRQRVAVGRALVREPQLLSMDEPLSNLDAKLQVRTRGEIRRLQQELGITTLYVTHDQEEAMSIADRIAIMNDGRLVQVGPPRDVYESPRNEFVAGFLGDPPMNFLDVVASEPGSTLSGDLACPDLSIPRDAVRVGVRPEDVYVITDKGNPRTAVQKGPGAHEPSLSASHTFEVEVVEPVGRVTELTVTRAEESLTVRVRELPPDVREGEPVRVAFDRDRLHWFDERGEAID
ncbi:ABC transporter ATP-binding protein [Halorussus salinisoli]|uniref:ABC transporter ATP-binding protein n=1 Tax=Halorussus salinisoli TaxID=2558242 RepID=UPI0010C24274|nr:ABC transporter ATP-binding protein [Halorussus salinisoli]